MVPTSIRRGLARLRRREFLLSAAWGLAACAGLAAALLGLACLTDWAIDRFQETPWALRVLMTGAQAVVIVAALIFLLLRPLLGRRSDAEVALQVERHHRGLRHL